MLLDFYIFLNFHLNSNIEIHKYLFPFSLCQEFFNLNSNIEIHKSSILEDIVKSIPSFKF